MPNKEIINIRSDGEGLASKLSNFYPYSFELDYITYASMEAFFGALRTPDLNNKKNIIDKSGSLAWVLGHKYSWIERQEVDYNGVTINRHSIVYDELITRAFDALFENPKYRQTLQESVDFHLIHTIGKTSKFKTLLTRREFIGQLDRLREKLFLERFPSLFDF